MKELGFTEDFGEKLWIPWNRAEEKNHEWMEQFQRVQWISSGRSDYSRNQRLKGETRLLEHSDLNLEKAIKIYQVKDNKKTKIQVLAIRK